MTEPDEVGLGKREGAWDGGVDRLNKNVKDFLDYEDSDSEDISAFGPETMNQTANIPI